MSASLTASEGSADVRVYIAGPMSGIPEHNFPAFREAAAALRRKGWDVISPVEMDEAEGFNELNEPNVEPGSPQWAEFLARDIRAVTEVDAVVVLPGWERSKGARLEVSVARELQKDILAYPGLGPVPESENVLEEANRIVSGTRGDTYGHPSSDFRRTAGIWSAILGQKVTPEQVALCMIGVKLSRLVATPQHKDSCVDVAGYAKCYEMLFEGRGGLR